MLFVFMVEESLAKSKKVIKQQIYDLDPNKVIEMGEFFLESKSKKNLSKLIVSLEEWPGSHMRINLKSSEGELGTTVHNPICGYNSSISTSEHHDISEKLYQKILDSLNKGNYIIYHTIEDEIFIERDFTCSPIEYGGKILGDLRVSKGKEKRFLVAKSLESLETLLNLNPRDKIKFEHRKMDYYVFLEISLSEVSSFYSNEKEWLNLVK